MKGIKLNKRAKALKLDAMVDEKKPMSSDDEALDSDEEIQEAFRNKKILPGLNIELNEPKKYINNKEGLKRKLQDIYLQMDWSERLDITVAKEKLVVANIDPEKLADNDFKREQAFFMQAQEAAIQGIKRLHGLGITTRRPDDYFAEMAKSDEHMKKIREEILSKHAELDRREKVRKLREMKKIGKQMQIESLKRKNDEKKNFNKSIEKIKKGDKDGFNVLAIENDDKKPKERKNKLGFRSEAHEKIDVKISKKQNYKDKKYGFGGRKKKSKYNTAESSADISDFNGKIHHKKDKFSKSPRNGFSNKKFTNKNKPNKKFKK